MKTIKLLNYCIEANICIVLLFAFYYFVLRKEPNFVFNRAYLLSSVLFSLSIPLFTFPLSASTMPGVKTLGGMQVFVLPEITVVSLSDQGSILSFAPHPILIFGLIYLLGTVLFSTSLLYRIYQVIHFSWKKSFNKVNMGHYILIETNGKLPTFSFWKYLFFDNTTSLTAEEKRQIIEHEEAHITQKHTMDIIFLEVLCAAFWVNPVVWLMKTAVSTTHEYLADRTVLRSQTDSEKYKALLVKQALSTLNLSIGSHFNQSITLKRIKMMNTTKNKLFLLKAFFTLPLMGLLFFAFSCSEKESLEELTTLVEGAPVVREIPVEAKKAINEMIAKTPNAQFQYKEIDIENQSKIENLNVLDAKNIAYIGVFKEREKIGLVLRTDQNQNTPSEQAKGEVFTEVEENATPKTGMQDLYSFIGKNLKYPKQARKQGIEGKVFIEFLVQPNGTMTDLEVIKGIGGGCDQEALNTLNAYSSPWEPGKKKGIAVTQKLVLPISFSLEDGDLNTEKTGHDEN